jgi:glycerophosphoryl diester phosphodiesterase
MIEFDVALTKDGQLVLMHDATVNRTTDGSGQVSDLTLAELKSLDAGSWKGQQFKGERVPTLDETLAMMPQNVWLNVHLKGSAKLAEKTTRRIVAHQRLHQAFLACGSKAARAANQVDPRIKICNMERQGNTLAYVNETIDMKADFIQFFGGKSVDPHLAKRLRERGIRINYCCANEAEKVRRLFDAGVEFPLVDRVGGMLEVADQLGIERLRPVYHPPFRVAPNLFDSSNVKTLGLKTVEGRHTLLYRATDDGYKFCHHPNLVIFRDRLYCMWSNGLADEDSPGQRILYSSSLDGHTWTEPVVLGDDKRGKGTCVAAGFHVSGQTLVAYYTALGATHFHPDTALMAQTSQDGKTWSKPQRITDGFYITGPRQLGNARLLLAGEHVGDSRKTKRMRILLSHERGGLGEWQDARIKPSDLSVFGFTEPTLYARQDGTIVMALRNYSGHLYASQSSDEGQTWTVPTRTDFPDSLARSCAGNLPDGTAYIINNPMPKRLDRSLLAIALSQDGVTFDRALLIRGGPTQRRYDGRQKLDGWQYPNAIVWKDCLYVAYSINKEDLGVTQIALKNLAVAVR